MTHRVDQTNQRKAIPYYRCLAPSPLRLLKRDLDEGEAEVIALAIEQKADVVLLDESDARKIAELYELVKTGVIRLLIRAKKEGRIESLKKELNTLRDKAGFWFNEKLYHQALQSVGEEP